VQSLSPTPDYLPSTEQLLIAGGDARLALDPFSGLNKYGCQPFPDSELLAFGSSTASVISTEGYAAANRLRQKILEAIRIQTPAAVYAEEIQRIRQEWLQLCELSDLTGLELIFSPSGTDTHAITAQYTCSGTSTPALIIMPEANETGSGVVSALADGFATDNHAAEVVQISMRLEDGAPRPSAEIDADVKTLVDKAVAMDRRILLILIDQSKTGLIAPSPACVIALHHCHPGNIEVLVDACQFRIAIPTLRAYLEQDFMVALTGSKFLTGPSFSAALLLPPAAAERLRKRTFPHGLLSCSSRTNWPINCPEAEQLKQIANFGLLLRLEVAVEELRRFRAVPQTAAIDFLQTFAEAIQQRLLFDPYFEPLSVPRLDRRPLIDQNNWDCFQTIFPFLLYDPRPAVRIPLTSEKTRHVYQQLLVTFDHSCSDDGSAHCDATSCIASIQPSIGYQLGQPVACGTRNGIALCTLRLCISSRLIIAATACEDKGKAIIKDALRALEKTALLIQSNDL
jgi:hypothetical protein